MNIKIISIINSVIFFLIIKISTVVAAEKFLEKEDKPKITKKEFDLAMDYYDKGVNLIELGKFEEAIAAYDLTIKYIPYFAWAYENKGSALSKLGRLEEAIAAYDLAIKYESDYEHYAQVYYNKGNALCQLSRFEEAIQAYDLAM